MLIQSLEQKTRLALSTVVISVVGCIIISMTAILGSYALIKKERNQIYVLDGNIPFLAERAELEQNFIMEAKAHIQSFHQYFFSLPPDNDYINWTLNKAMYLADGSALKQKQALDENGFYSDIVSSSSIASIRCDSITFDEKSHRFTYYGKQKIKRRTKEQLRTLITSGELVTVPRSSNNPHGLMVTKWQTIENKDISH